MSDLPVQPDHFEAHQQFVSLLVQNHARILGYIRAFVPHRQDAEDLYQKVSLTLWSKFDEFERDRDFFAWASGIAFFTVCNYRRTKYRNCLTFNQELIETMARERLEHLTSQKSRLDQLIDCVDKLPQPDRQLIMQAYSIDSSVRDIAEQTGKAVQTIYNRLTQLRRDLAACVRRNTVIHSPAT
ncbi:sigma-70 family RNA polymerase sigma factor [Planctomicrobium sp. SH664]|uniref:sigma-70 family RNA polymerase sigma factor n=1 Tax=Planctomicrobium sp. SH664 TaxID=3448125 RepID=UPI003F5AF866